jgi:hypothetical protein
VISGRRPERNVAGEIHFARLNESRSVGDISRVFRKPKRIQFWKKSWSDAINTHRVRMAHNVEGTD